MVGIDNWLNSLFPNGNKTAIICNLTEPKLSKSDYKREYRQKNKKAIAEYARVYHQENKEFLNENDTVF